MLILLLILFPMAAAPVLFALEGRQSAARRWAPGVCAAAEAVLSLLLIFLPGTLTVPNLLVGGLHFAPDGFQVCYGLLSSLLWLGAVLFSRDYFRKAQAHLGSYWAFLFLTLGAVQGLFLSADFMTGFCFFEMLSLCSFPWVMHERNEGAIRAGCTYLAVSVIGGLILFLGLLLLRQAAGTLVYAGLPGALAGTSPKALRTASLCILLGFGAKAGMFPLHVWLPKAHPVAPAPASALLSGMLTKAGVFGILITGQYVLRDDGSFGLLVLSLGLITMALGAVMALFSVQLKHTLACSSMSQIGFILTGISAAMLCRSGGDGHGASMALSGAALHMVNHSLLKLSLFLSAGAVAMNVHDLELSRIRGWGRRRHLLKAVFLIASLGISGVPGFCGYLSKTLLHEGLSEAIHASGIPGWTEWVFLASGGLTLAYMTKLFVCVFVEKNRDPALQEAYDSMAGWASPLSRGILAFSAALLLPMGIPGIAGALSGRMLGETVPIAAFHWEALGEAMISLGIGAAVYLLFLRPVLAAGGAYRALWPEWLDLENGIYRPLLLRALPAVLGPLARLFGENLVLRPLCRGLVWLGAAAGRALDTGMDGLILLLRRTLLREVPVRDGKPGKEAGDSVLVALRMALGDVVDNFSFAMTVACMGIVLVFLLVLILR